MLFNDSVQEFGFNLPYEAAYREPVAPTKTASTMICAFPKNLVPG